MEVIHNEVTSEQLEIMWCGNPLLAIPEGHQNPKYSVTPPAHGPQENSPLHYKKSSKYLWGTTPPSHFPRYCEDKSKTNKSKTQQGQSKVSEMLVADLRSGDRSRYAATLLEQSLPSCLLFMEMKGEKISELDEQHRIHIQSFKNSSSTFVAKGV